MPHHPNEQRREDCCTKDDPERGLGEIATRRLVGELAGAEFEIAFNQGEVGSRLIHVSQREDVFVWHVHVMPERGYSIPVVLCARPSGGGKSSPLPLPGMMRLRPPRTP
jgi:hypothetical protein